MSLVKTIRDTFVQIAYLRKTYAPLDIFVSSVNGRIRNGAITQPFLNAQNEYRKLKPSLKLTSDWFTPKIPFLLSVFSEYRLLEKKAISALEIGSWEGLSSHFFLHSLPNATLTCVDTWEGADEHKEGGVAKSGDLSGLELTFDSNLAPFRNRLIKYKGTSLSFFHDHPSRNTYDLIYVDGSHYYDDVLIDGLKCFEMLKMGGVMIFDDYFWKHYPAATDNPAAAINSFLRLKKGSYRIVRMYYQVVIEKTKDRPPPTMMI